MLELIASVFALGVVAQVVFWVVAGVLFPAFWLWMLIDAGLRRDCEYASATSNEKILWIVGMLFFQVVAVVYFFAVYRLRSRSSAACAPAATAPPVAPVA